MINDKDLTEELPEELFDDQVLITGITWNKSHNTYHSRKSIPSEELPIQFTLNIPESVLKQAKQSNCYNDVIETFVYNFLTHKFGYEVNSCSIWLPLNKK